MHQRLGNDSAGAKFRAAVRDEKPLQVVGAINAYAARMAEATGLRALYLSGGGVAANSLGMPDLGISTLDDVLTDVRRITDVTSLPLLVDIDTGWGGAFNIARTIRSMIKAGAAAVHIEDQVSAKRCGHRPGKELVPADEMADRIKAAVDARTDESFVIMARTDALAGEGLEAALERARTYVSAGADMIFAEAVTELGQYAEFRKAAGVPGFGYSDSLKKLNIRWDDASLDKWLNDPDAMAPDTDMAFRLADGAERKAVIAYLKSLGGQ